MNRSIITILYFLFSITFIYGQGVAYNDAIYIKSVMDANHGEFRFCPQNKFIFDYYFGAGLTDSQLNTAIKANSYLNSYFGIGTQSIPEGLTFSGAVSTAGNLDITTLADGFAKFIVKRTRQELSTAFFDHFKDDLAKYKDLRDIFPQTYRALSAIGDEIYMYDIYLQTIRESFKEDLAALPTNLPMIIDNHEEYFNKRHDLKAELLTAFYIAQAIQDNKHPGVIIENYPIETLDSVRPNLKAAFKTLKLFSKSLKSNNDSTYWVSKTEINRLTTDDQLLTIYLGLVLQLAKRDSIQFDNNGSSFNLADRMNKNYKNLQPYKIFIGNIATKTQLLETKIQGLKKNRNDSLLFENYYSIVSASIDLMKYMTQIDQLSIFKNDSLNLAKNTAPYFDFAQTTSDIVIDVHRRNYSSAILNASYIAQSLNTAGEDVSQRLLKYGTFMATVATAKNSNDVQASIEAIALPSGSSRIKRESKSNVSINAYCGIYGGKNIAGGWSTGLTAPVGIAASWGICRHSSFSLFLSIIDLGAPVAFRFSTKSDSVPAIKLADIISPGLFLSWGIPKCPVSINAGLQMTPVLTSVSTKENTFGTKSMRITIGACIDLPILNLYNKSK